MNPEDMLIDVFANWLFTLIVSPATLIFLIQNFGIEFVFSDFVKLILEFVFIGMLPLIIVFIRKELGKLWLYFDKLGEKYCLWIDFGYSFCDD